MSKSHEQVVRDFANGKPYSKGSRVFAEDTRLFSYGHHFTLAVRPRDREDFGAGIKFIVNGDRYSATTSKHTNYCLSELQDNVQIPFSALSAAGYTDRWNRTIETVTIIDHRPDRWWTECVTCGQKTRFDYEKTGKYLHENDDSPVCTPSDPDSHAVRSEHLLGAVLLTFGDGKFYLSSTDENEPARLRSYFLSQLPHEVSTIVEAYKSLQPEEVKEAFSQGKEVKRQGDIFLIPFDVPTRHIHGEKFRRHPILNTTHVATEARVNGNTLVRGVLRHRPLDQWGYPRRPQHVPVKLGKLWHMAFRNTAIASFNAVGNVD